MKKSQLTSEERRMLRDEFRRNEFSKAESKEDWEHWWRCFSKQSCGACLNAKQCSWCPFTWACVPNKQDIPLLAPAYQDQMCPSPEEQWELRTKPFGCRVSSFTALSIAIAILATILVGLLTALLVALVKFSRRRIRRRKRKVVKNREREPLLLAQPD